MSKPQNPLNEFRSFSYYFLMGVAGSTQAIEAAAKSVGAEEARGEKGNWTLLINGAKDTKFIIKSVRFQSILTPNEHHKSESYFHTMNLGGEVTIQEPMGIRLYEDLRNAAEKYAADMGGLNFFLKPIFVGYKPNQPPTVISNTKAYLFMGVEMTSAINEGGATYNMKTMGVVNGAAKTKAYQTIADGFSIELLEGSTLDEAMFTVELKLNEIWAASKERDEKATKAQGMNVNYDEQKPINYSIQLDDYYKSGNHVVGTNTKDVYKSKASEGGGKLHVVQATSSDIDSLIKQVMLTCEAVVKDDRAKPKGDYIVTKKFNIQQYVESTESSIEVKYFIAPFDMEFVPTNYSGSNPGKSLEFDYIYTGKNIDIRNFDMKMQMGSIWFNTPAIANTLDMAMEQNQNNCVGVSPTASKVNKDGSGGAKGAPEVHSNKGLEDKDTNNKANAVATSSYLSQLKRWAALESYGVKLEIKGNPQLLEETTFTPEDVKNGEPYAKEGTLYSDQGAFKGPVRIKVNVKFPANYEDPRSNFVKFWYDGAYNVIDIDNVFEDGDFIQIITMFANASDMYNDTGTQEACKDNARIGGPAELDADYTKPPLEEKEQLTVITELPELPGKLASFLSETANNFDKVLDGTADILKSVTQDFTILSDTIKKL